MAQAVSRHPVTQKPRFQVQFVLGFMVEKEEVGLLSPWLL